MRRVPVFVIGVLLAGCAARPAAPPAVPVFFPSASVTLGAEAQQHVARAASLARQYPNSRIRLVGYALPANAVAEPIRLSQQRAAAVRTELVRDGVSIQRIEDSVGSAAVSPIDSQIANRRVDIIFLP